MGALLVHDICNPSSKAYPQFKLRNPVDLFKFGAFHGGVWRCGYKVDSIGETAAMRYYLGAYGPTVRGAGLVWRVGMVVFSVSVPLDLTRCCPFPRPA